MDTTNRQYFDADKLLRDIYNKIVVWHNNDERLSNVEMGRELRFLSKEIVEDVLKAVHGDKVQITLDKHKLGMSESEVEQDMIEREKRRLGIQKKIEEEARKSNDNASS